MKSAFLWFFFIFVVIFTLIQFCKSNLSVAVITPPPPGEHVYSFQRICPFFPLFLPVILAVPADRRGESRRVDRNGEADGPVPAAADGGQDPRSGQDCHLPEGTGTASVALFIFVCSFEIQKVSFKMEKA